MGGTRPTYVINFLISSFSYTKKKGKSPLVMSSHGLGKNTRRKYLDVGSVHDQTCEKINFQTRTKYIDMAFAYIHFCDNERTKVFLISSKLKRNNHLLMLTSKAYMDKFYFPNALSMPLHYYTNKKSTRKTKSNHHN